MSASRMLGGFAESAFDYMLKSIESGFDAVDEPYRRGYQHGWTLSVVWMLGELEKADGLSRAEAARRLQVWATKIDDALIHWRAQESASDSPPIPRDFYASLQDVRDDGSEKM